MISPFTPTTVASATGGDVSISRRMDNDYDYQTPEVYRHYTHAVAAPAPPAARLSTNTLDANHQTPTTEAAPPLDGEDALLDLAQLEELQMEAEKMKALGNKHMAAQEYTRAFNAYSAALQLCPVGPSSHVFLCNRAAALLSLKRYQAAAIDARRAVALAPTFGKAHARLGQALYFLKDYNGAVRAYEDALAYEPDNTVTSTYLEKARVKLARKHEKAMRMSRGEDVSLAEESMPATVIHSVATDPHASAAVVTAGGFRGDSAAIRNAVAGLVIRSPPTTTIHTGRPNATSPLTPDDNMDAPHHLPNTPTVDDDQLLEDDPDLEEAVRIQQRGNQYLTQKNYKAAIEEYSAALFLVPDDPFLSPELHLGRAHALNGSRRHESARHDAQMAIKIQPTPEAYSTLAKTLFYLKDYAGAIQAFHECKQLLPQGAKLSMFDQAYLDKAQVALAEDGGQSLGDDHRSLSSKQSVVPKLPPPRFVPRTEALQATPNMPPMPKQWPQQSPQSPTTFLCGPERVVYFLSEALGIKLNRGADGIVRVLSVAPDTPGSPILRKGSPIQEGDVVREAAGVDLRRPITNVMWGDTVALIKIAPRPIAIAVAQELSPIPPSVLDERKRQQDLEEKREIRRSQQQLPGTIGGERSYDEDDGVEQMYEEDYSYYQQPSPSSGEGKIQTTTPASNHAEGVSVMTTSPDTASSADTAVVTEQDDLIAAPTNAGDLTSSNAGEVGAGLLEGEVVVAPAPGLSQAEGQDEDQSPVLDGACKNEVDSTALDIQLDLEQIAQRGSETAQGALDIGGPRHLPVDVQALRSNDDSQPLSSRDEEMNVIGGEILFEDSSSSSAHSDWDRLRWMSYSGIRKVRFCESVMRLFSSKKAFFWSSGGVDEYMHRKLAIYEEPPVMLLLRRPTDVGEIRKILDLPSGMVLGNDPSDNAINAFWVVESVVEPIACKLRLSPLTTVTSVETSSSDEGDIRRYSCFELVSPAETIILSARAANSGKHSRILLENDEAWVETQFLEAAVGTALFQAHIMGEEGELLQRDKSWKHQIILGSLHSYVLSGNQALLEKSMSRALARLYPPQLQSSLDGSPKVLPSQVIDARDENGFTALHYACSRGLSAAVISLVSAGANVMMKATALNMAPGHFSALRLDEVGLSTILSTSNPARPDPNEIDALGRTPMYVAAVEGRCSDGSYSSLALGHCLSALEAWGGQIFLGDNFLELQHPISVLASEWRSDSLLVLFQHTVFQYPLLETEYGARFAGISLSAMFHYPVHFALIALRKEIAMVMNGVKPYLLGSDELQPECRLIMTLRVLLEHGLEPNERIDRLPDAEFPGAVELNEYVGFSPIQVLALAALDAIALQQVAEQSDEGSRLKILGDLAATAEFLVQSGARLGLESPLLSRRVSRSPSPSFHRPPSSSDKIDGDLRADRSLSKLESNKQIMKILGGEERLAAARKSFCALQSVTVTSKLVLLRDKNVALNDSAAPGGSDEKSCAICWKAFGALVNRKHKCRVTVRYICDDCSSRRVISDGEEIRLSDGQFLFARVEAAKEEGQCEQSELERQRVQQLRAEKAELRVRRLEAEEESDRESLFSGVIDMASNFVFGEDDQKCDNDVPGLSQTLGQTRNALVERGAKLEALGEKTSRLADASRDFAQMAKELSKEAQKGGLFW